MTIFLLSLAALAFGAFACADMLRLYLMRSPGGADRKGRADRLLFVLAVVGAVRILPGCLRAVLHAVFPAAAGWIYAMILAGLCVLNLAVLYWLFQRKGS